MSNYDRNDLLTQYCKKLFRNFSSNAPNVARYAPGSQTRTASSVRSQWPWTMGTSISRLLTAGAPLRLQRPSSLGHRHSNTYSMIDQTPTPWVGGGRRHRGVGTNCLVNPNGEAWRYEYYNITTRYGKVEVDQPNISQYYVIHSV